MGSLGSQLRIFDVPIVKEGRMAATEESVPPHMRFYDRLCRNSEASRCQSWRDFREVTV